MIKKVVAALLVLGLLAAVPLAYASPPDQTWLGGWYDNADYDDVVLAVTSAVAALNSVSPMTLLPIPVVVDHAWALPWSRYVYDNFVFIPLRAPPLG